MYYINMKISKISKKTNKSFSFIISCAAVALLASCGSTKVDPVPEPEEPKVEESAPAPIIEEPKIEKTAPAPVIEEPVPVVEEPKVEEQKVEEPAEEADDEYTRSVGNVAVDRDTFADDKQKVLQIISELDSIMKNLNYNAWLPYVEKSSIDYWKLRKNLQKAEKRLPIKGIKLKDLQDYFKQVFVPSRKGREINEIRYISDTYIKAVQVGEKQKGQKEAPVTVYYYFNKINGKWQIHLPTNEELN